MEKNLLITLTSFGNIRQLLDNINASDEDIVMISKIFDDINPRYLSKQNIGEIVSADLFTQLKKDHSFLGKSNQKQIIRREIKNSLKAKAEIMSFVRLTLDEISIKHYRKGEKLLAIVIPLDKKKIYVNNFDINEFTPLAGDDYLELKRFIADIKSNKMT